MNLTFNVCWIEDQATEAFVAMVEAAIRQNGFEPKVERIATPDEIADFAKRQEQFYDYELILLDLQLGEQRGDEIAKVVRQQFRSTPLLFYSGADETNLRKLMYEAGIEGVYCVHREGLPARVQELVGELSPALNRLNSMRGLAAQTVAMCDERFREIIMHCAKDEARGNAIFRSLQAKLTENASTRIDDLKAITSLEDLIETTPTAALFVEVMRLAKEDGAANDDILDLRRSLKKDFRSKLLIRRHTLAHVIEERTDKEFLVRKPDGTPLTRDDFIRYRADFAIILRDVSSLRGLLIPQEA